MNYNSLNLPMAINDELNSNYRALYTYDASGSKLKKYFDRPPCSPCDEPAYSFDYLGNFVFRDGEIDHILHVNEFFNDGLFVVWELLDFFELGEQFFVGELRSDHIIRTSLH